MSQPVAPTIPAGWHPDPFQRHQGRYWDGTRWTEHVDDGGVQGVDPPPPPADRAVLDAPAVIFQHEEVRWADRAARLGVFAGDEGTPQLGWVHYAAHQARLTDMAGAPILTVGTSFGNLASRRPLHLDTGAIRNPGAVRALSVWGPFGEHIARRSSTTTVIGGGYTFNLQGQGDALKISLNRGRRGELGVVGLFSKLTGAQIGAVVEIDRTQTGSIVSSWLRLDRQPGLAEPLRTLTTAAPMLLLTTFS